MREIQIRISDSIKRNRKDREVTEQEMLVLVEHVVEKIKIEMLEMNI